MTTTRKKQKSPMEKVNDLFAAQHGLAADRQIRDAGVSSDRALRLIRKKVWTRYARGIVAAGGAAATWKQRAMAATLSAPGAMLSGRSAAHLHGLDGWSRYDAVEVIVHASTHVCAIDGVTYRYSRHISADDRHVIESIPVTMLPVTLVHLKSAGHNAEQALDGALRDGFSATWLHQHFVRWQSLTRLPATAMLQALSDRVDTRLPLSWFQRIAKGLLEIDGVPLVDEFPVLDTDGKRLAVLDLADAKLMVGVECQSWRWHGSPGAQAHDVVRKRRLRQVGWEIVDVWWSDLDRIDGVLADLRLAVKHARARLPSVSKSGPE